MQEENLNPKELFEELKNYFNGLETKLPIPNLYRDIPLDFNVWFTIQSINEQTLLLELLGELYRTTFVNPNYYNLLDNLLFSIGYLKPPFLSQYLELQLRTGALMGIKVGNRDLHQLLIEAYSKYGIDSEVARIIYNQSEDIKYRDNVIFKLLAIDVLSNYHCNEGYVLAILQSLLPYLRKRDDNLDKDIVVSLRSLSRKLDFKIWRRFVNQLSENFKHTFKQELANLSEMLQKMVSWESIKTNTTEHYSPDVVLTIATFYSMEHLFALEDFVVLFDTYSNHLAYHDDFVILFRLIKQSYLAKQKKTYLPKNLLAIYDTIWLKNSALNALPLNKEYGTGILDQNKVLIQLPYSEETIIVDKTKNSKVLVLLVESLGSEIVQNLDMINAN